MLAGELYIADDPQLAADNLRALTLTSQFNNSDPADAQARLALLRELLGSVGEGTEIRPPLYCDYGYQTHIGARTFINFGCVLLDVATITIGDDVQVGPNVQFLAGGRHAARAACDEQPGDLGAEEERHGQPDVVQPPRSRVPALAPCRCPPGALPATTPPRSRGRSRVGPWPRDRCWSFMGSARPTVSWSRSTCSTWRCGPASASS